MQDSVTHAFLNESVESRVILFGEIAQKSYSKLYDIGQKMETTQTHLGKSWKSVMYHTSSSAMPKSGMYSSFKTNSDYCQSPQFSVLIYIVVGLGVKGGERERERKPENKSS